MSLLEDWWKLLLLSWKWGAARGCAEFLNSAGAGPDGVDVVGPGSALGQVVLACTTFGDIATKT